MTAKPSKTILILVGPEYEDLEVWYPKLRLEEAGYEPKLVGLGEKEYRGKHGYPCPVDGKVSDFPAETLAGIIAPGGWAPDKIRRDADVLKWVREVHEAKRMVATICHGPWILISAGILRGRKLTSTVGIRDEPPLGERGVDVSRALHDPADHRRDQRHNGDHNGNKRRPHVRHSMRDW